MGWRDVGRLGPAIDAARAKGISIGLTAHDASAVQINEEPTTRCSLEEVTRVIQRSGAEGPRRTLKVPEPCHPRLVHSRLVIHVGEVDRRHQHL